MYAASGGGVSERGHSANPVHGASCIAGLCVVVGSDIKGSEMGVWGALSLLLLVVVFIDD